jgi:xanthine dehydrogenase YagS FAD-binding subunit
VQPFTYTRVGSVVEALHAASEPTERGGRFIAGGTTLVDLMKLDVMHPGRLIDIGSIAELQQWSTAGDAELVIGALAKMSDVSADPVLIRDYPALSEALWKAASQQLRNMATVGGNLLQRTRCEYFRGTTYPCNKRSPGSGCAALDGINRGHALFGGSDACIATYPGDFAVALAAFDALVDTESPRRRRTIPLLDLHCLPGDTPHVETVLEPDELVMRVRIPVTRAGRASAFHKIRDRESYAFATVSAAVALNVEDGEVRDARVALGGVATKPWRATAAERSLLGRPFTREAAERAGTIAFEEAKPRDGNRFKLSLGPKCVAQALTIANERSGA